MKYFILLITFLQISFANLVSFNYIESNDLKILRELDIESEFIADLELQSLYNQYLSKNKSYYIDTYKESLMIIPTIKSILQKENVPNSILFLGMAESNFNLNASSHMKAKGLWQFIPNTAKRYGLQNNLYFDERLDIEKSTLAATKYLKHLHTIFGKWYLAMIAYNCGEGRLIEGIIRVSLDLYIQDNPEFKNTKEYKYYKDIINKYQNKKVGFRELNSVYQDIKKLNIRFGLSDLSTLQPNTSRQYIPLESRNHIKKIVSFAMMMNKNIELSDENRHLLNRGLHKLVTPVQASGGVHLKTLAKEIGADYDTLVIFNSHLKEQYIPLETKSYQIYIPYETLNTYNQKKDNIPKISYHIHIVQNGDNLSKIGQKYKISYQQIKEYNNLQSDKLKLKQKLIIPIPQESITNNTNVELTDLRYKSNTIEYKVKKGDTLGSIAKNYQVALNKLINDNKLKSNTIFEGDTIVIKY